MALFVWCLSASRMGRNDGRLSVIAELCNAPVRRRASALDRLASVGLVQQSGDDVTIVGFDRYVGGVPIRWPHAKLLARLALDPEAHHAIGSATSTLAWVYLRIRDAELGGTISLRQLLSWKATWGTRKQVEKDLVTLHGLQLIELEEDRVVVPEWDITNDTPERIEERRAGARDRQAAHRTATGRTPNAPSVSLRQHLASSISNPGQHLASSISNPGTHQKPAESEVCHGDLDSDQEKEREEYCPSGPKPVCDSIGDVIARVLAGAMPPPAPTSRHADNDTKPAERAEVGTWNVDSSHAVSLKTDDHGSDATPVAKPIQEAVKTHPRASRLATRPIAKCRRRVPLAGFAPDVDALVRDGLAGAGEVGSLVAAWRADEEANKGRECTPERWSKRLTAWLADRPNRALVEAYADGVRAGLGRPWAPPPSKTDDLDTIKSAIDGHCPRGADRVAWLRRAAEAFAFACRWGEDPRFWSCYMPRGLVRWLNSGEFHEAHPMHNAGATRRYPILRPEPKKTPEEIAAEKERAAKSMAVLEELMAKVDAEKAEEERQREATPPPRTRRFI